MAYGITRQEEIANWQAELAFWEEMLVRPRGCWTSKDRRIFKANIYGAKQHLAYLQAAQADQPTRLVLSGSEDSPDTSPNDPPIWT